jgi:hypothetical protein
MLGHRVLALEHFVANLACLRFPLREYIRQCRLDVVALGADDAVHRPDHELALGVGFQRLQVGCGGEGEKGVVRSRVRSRME